MQAIFLKLLCKLMFCANVKEINEIIFVGFVCSVNVTKYSIYGLQVGRVHCRKLWDICRKLHVNKFPAFYVFKRIGGYEIYYGTTRICFLFIDQNA